MRRLRGLLLVTVLLAAAVAFVLERRGGAEHHVDTKGTRVEHFTLHSRLLRRDLDEIAIRTGPRRPVVVLLHGRGSGPGSFVRPELFDALRALGRRAPDVLLLAGENSSYYHDRRLGPWGSYVLREAIPAGIRKLGADPRRVAIGGVSMGGFGALDLARIAPHRFCAVGGHSAALWQTGGETPYGAFDDAEDFARHDVIGFARARRVYRVPVWLDAGTDDPFRRADEALAAALRAHGTRVTLHVSPGGHGWTYWASHLAQYLGFYARTLRSCA